MASDRDFRGLSLEGRLSRGGGQQSPIPEKTPLRRSTCPRCLSGSVVGRPAGSLAEFPSYSDALKKAGDGGLVWNEETLDKWIADAAGFVPESNMFYSQPDPDKRKLIIGYLKSTGSSMKGEAKN